MKRDLGRIISNNETRKIRKKRRRMRGNNKEKEGNKEKEQ